MKRSLCQQSPRKKNYSQEDNIFKKNLSKKLCSHTSYLLHVIPNESELFNYKRYLNYCYGLKEQNMQR